jgi:signal peptidase I
MTTTTGTSPRARRTPAGVVGDVLLWIGAAGGLVCIIAVLAAVLFHVTLIMFKTGSMEPTIPTGALAVVQEIPASQVQVGDIVTVDRADALPITHRVTSVSGEGESRLLTMRGDANASEDPAPYDVTHVRLVLTWMPGWAQIVVWFSNPLVLGALTLAATALVGWAFWPRDDDTRTPRARRLPPPRTRRRLPRDANGYVVIKGISIGLSIAVAAIVVAPAPPAQAAEVEHVVRSTYLELTSISDPDLTNAMTPGVPVTWQVGVDAFPPDPGIVHLGIAATGALVTPGDLSIRVDACPTRWVAGACASGATSWMPDTDLADAVAPVTAYGAHEIGTMNAFSQVWLLMAVTLTAPGPLAPGDVAQLRLQAWGVGQPLAVGGSSLAATGGGAGSFAPAALGIVAVLGGLLLALGARRRGLRRG